MKKGFAFILDAILAIILLSAFMGLTLNTINTKKINEFDGLSKNILANDLLEAMQKEGSLQTMDTRRITEKINLQLPISNGWKAEIKKYEFNSLTGSFELKEIELLGNQEESLKNKTMIKVKRFWMDYSNNKIHNYFEMNLSVWDK